MLLQSGGLQQLVALDGSEAAPEATQGNAVPVRVADLSQPLSEGLAATVLSYEVAEHIPRQHEEVFLDNLCRRAGHGLIIS